MSTKPLSVSIPHRLGQDAARAKLQTGLADLKTKFGANLADVQETWNGNQMAFRFAVMGQSVTGRVDVLPDVVKLDIDLPFFLAMLAENLKPRIEQEGRKLLS